MAEPRDAAEVLAQKEKMREKLRGVWGWRTWREEDVREPYRIIHGVHLFTAQDPEGPLVRWQHPERCDCDVPALQEVES